MKCFHVNMLTVFYYIFSAWLCTEKFSFHTMPPKGRFDAKFENFNFFLIFSKKPLDAMTISKYTKKILVSNAKRIAFENFKSKDLVLKRLLITSSLLL